MLMNDASHRGILILKSRVNVLKTTRNQLSSAEGTFKTWESVRLVVYQVRRNDQGVCVCVLSLNTHHHDHRYHHHRS